MMFKDVERLETDVFLIVSGRYLAEVLFQIETRLLQWSKQHICEKIAQKIAQKNTQKNAQKNAL